MSKTVPVSDSAEHSKAERVYRELRRRIRGLELQPGSRLQKNEIAVEFGVSRAPVSEAIAWLAEEGLVDVYPQSGSFVAPIRPEDVREALLIRTGLEVEAVRRVTQIADPQLLKRLDDNLEAQSAAVRKNDMALLDDLDEAFHGIIIGALESPRAQRLRGLAQRRGCTGARAAARRGVAWADGGVLKRVARLLSPPARGRARGSDGTGPAR